jgi:hypothetical protein
MITNFTLIIYLDYRGFDYCDIFRGNSRGIPVTLNVF